LSEVANEADESESVSEDDKERVEIYLGRLEDSKESVVSLYCQLSVDIVVNNRSILSKPGNKFIYRYIQALYYKSFHCLLADEKQSSFCLKAEKRSGGCDLFDVADLRNYVDSEGSLNLKMQLAMYSEVKGAVHKEENDIERSLRASLDEKFDRELLNHIESLLGNKKTADVVILVVGCGDKSESGKFYCHSAILSGEK